MWYLITKLEEYDRSEIQIDRFITKTLEKYSTNQVRENGSWVRYKREKIKVK